MIRKLSMIGLISSSLIAGAVNAAPQFLITHNRTNDQSNAFVNGTIPSPHPTSANSDGKVLWAMVKLACLGHIQNNQCKALVKMKTNTSSPVDVGYLSMNVDTGAITPKSLVANGYKLTVNGPGEATISYAK